MKPLLEANARINFRMDLYFVLSGFILSYIYMKFDEELTAGAYLSFLRARLIRLYPGHLATLLLLVAALFGGRMAQLPITGGYDFRALPFHLTLTQAWPLLRLGKLSYALFVSHAVAQKLLKIVLPAYQFAASPIHVRLLVLLLCVLVIFAFALALHFLVELPCARFLKALSATRFARFPGWRRSQPDRNPVAAAHGGQEKAPATALRRQEVGGAGASSPCA